MRSKNNLSLFFILLILLLFFLILGCEAPNTFNSTPAHTWTVMVYSDADNNLESFLLADILEMKNGFINSDYLKLIVLIDRRNSYSPDASILGENFEDTRLYRITKDNAERLSGGTVFPEITLSSNYEANMGDAETLKKFITYCKTYYKADKYALILSNHGGGTRSQSSSSLENVNKAVCWDDTDGNDCLYTAEITDVLTPSESVDLLGFDACFMGSVEVAYQFRPDNNDFNAQVMVASAPTEWGYGWKYDNIFARISNAIASNGEIAQITGGYETYYNPAYMTALQFGGIIVEEQRDSAEGSSTSEQLSCYDLNSVASVKNVIDNLAVSLYINDNSGDLENIRGSNTLNQSSDTMFYFGSSDEFEWISYPFFDLYDLCDQIENDGSVSASSKLLAATAKNAIDTMIKYSYAGSSYTHFTKNTSGVSIFFPDGNRIYSASPHWAYQWWYNSIDTASTLGPAYLYGKLSWCSDNQSTGDSTPSNWFELLDYWFDYTNNSSGGYNGYQY